jgi:hypothetical protein
MTTWPGRVLNGADVDTVSVAPGTVRVREGALQYLGAEITDVRHRGSPEIECSHAGEEKCVDVLNENAASKQDATPSFRCAKL